MNVSFEQIDAVNGLLTVELKRDDFASEVNKEVAAMGQRHPIKGFRPGHAPKSLLMKYYGASATADVIDRKVGRAVYDYIRENKDFIAVTQVRVCDRNEKDLFRTHFLNVSTNHIEIILPAE